MVQPSAVYQSNVDGVLGGVHYIAFPSWRASGGVCSGAQHATWSYIISTGGVTKISISNFLLHISIVNLYFLFIIYTEGLPKVSVSLFISLLYLVGITAA